MTFVALADRFHDGLCFSPIYDEQLASFWIIVQEEIQRLLVSNELASLQWMMRSVSTLHTHAPSRDTGLPLPQAEQGGEPERVSLRPNEEKATE